VGVGAAGLAVPDASPAVDIFDRSAARITVSVGQAWQTMLDLPSLLTARMGAGALAVTVAGVAGVPVVAKTVNGDRTATATVPARISTTAQATSTTGSTGLSPAQERAMAEIERIRAEADGRRRAAEARARAQRAEQRDAARRRAAEQRRAAQAAAAPAPASSSSTSSPQSTPAATPAAQPQLEFGP
jgi:hypothetical protein